MNCSEFQEKLSDFLDGRLPPDQAAALQQHLASCPDCRAEADSLKSLAQELDMIHFKEPTDIELQRYWAGIYNRIERTLGWILLSVGLIVLLSYGAFMLIENFIRDPSVAATLKIGVIATILGLIVLFVSILRERMVTRKQDRYSREIDR